MNVSIIFSKCHSNNTGNICSVKDSLQWVTTSTGCLHIYTYKSDKILSNPNLVVVIHGDAPFNKPGYQYLMAKKIAERNSNSIAIGLLRPGYTDPDGNTSDGKKGLTTVIIIPKKLLMLFQKQSNILKYYITPIK